ncbi:hypothetical protein NBRC10513v2_007661 [Rhodotorula toruloides]
MPPPSLAQTLPPELLSRIFGFIIDRPYPAGASVHYSLSTVWPITAQIPDLRNASLVCRQWRTPAQHALFQSIDLTVPGLHALVTAFHSRPELASATRAAVFEVETDDIDSFRQFDFLCDTALRALRHCVNLQHLAIGFVTSDMRDNLVDLLDTLPLKTLVLTEDSTWSALHMDRLTRLSPLELCALAQKPTLRHYELALGHRLAQFQSSFAPIPSLHAQLTTLSVRVDVPSCLNRLLAMCSKTLRNLNIVAETSPADENFLASLGGLSRLRELRIFIEEPSAGIISFSSTLSRLTKLKKLVVPDTFACPAFILHGPPYLKHIVYDICGDSMLALEHVRAHLAEGSSRLHCKTLEVVRPYTDSDDDWDHDSEDEGEPETDDEEKAKIAALSAVCRCRGVRLKSPRGHSSSSNFRLNRISFL